IFFAACVSFFFFFSSRRRHTRFSRDWSSDVCSSDLDGYKSVCIGGDGCPPAMPPRHYWSHHYQCDEGKCQIMAWYDGFHHGVLAAQIDGCEGRCEVLCAQDLYGNKPCATDHSEIEHRVVPESEM